MRKFLSIVISIIYLFSSAGATVQVHYCMGEQVGAGLTHKDDQHCPKCGMEKTYGNGCCKDVTTTLKTAEHSPRQLQTIHHESNAVVPSAAVEAEDRIQSWIGVSAYNCPFAAVHQPTLEVPIYLFVRNFRI